MNYSLRIAGACLCASTVLPSALAASNTPPSRAAVVERIAAGRLYMLRFMHPRDHGAPRLYRVHSDTTGSRLHTTYTASVVYTLLKLQSQLEDDRGSKAVRDGAGFLLSMQHTDRDEHYGAFHYSLDLKTRERESRFVVGTTSKCIYALIPLYRHTGDETFLVSARQGADWLCGMIREDGSVCPAVQESKGKWTRVERHSLLYDGQVLSALSRLHSLTEEDRYLLAAGSVARRLASEVNADGGHSGDDYRRPNNPISTAWIVMSLLDYWKAGGGEQFRDLALRCSRTLLGERLMDPQDQVHYGRWDGIRYTSGNAWIAEVLAQVYTVCREEDRADCDAYREAVMHVIRWLEQYTYTSEDAAGLRNPTRAVGGLMRSPFDPDIRIDSVCHALNAYVDILPHLP